MPELEASVRGREDAAPVTVMVFGSINQLRRVLAQTGFSGVVLLDVPGSGQAAIGDRYGVKYVPWTLVVNQSGRAVRVLVGGEDRQGFSAALDALGP